MKQTKQNKKIRQKIKIKKLEIYMEINKLELHFYTYFGGAKNNARCDRKRRKERVSGEELRNILVTCAVI